MKTWIKYLLLLPLVALSACMACTEDTHLVETPDAVEQYGFVNALDDDFAPGVTDMNANSATALVARTLPKVWVRMTNKTISNDTMTVSVEFKGENPGMRHGGMNVRLFFPNDQLTWIGLYNFAPGYGLMTAGQPKASIGGATSGPILFGFPGSAVYVNGAMDLINNSAPPIYMDEWVRLYDMKFKVKKDGNCPIVIQDKERLPNENGGFLPSDGVTIVYYTAASPNISAPTDEFVEHWNWKQTKDKYPTFGQPVPCQAPIQQPN